MSNKEKFIKFKENMNDKRFRSFIFLIFWLVVAVIVISVYRPSYNESVKSYQEKTADEVSSTFMKNYSYTILDTIDSKINVITGKTYNDYSLFVINGVTYYYNGKVYKIDNVIKEMSDYKMGYLNITPNVINNMIEKSEVVDTNKYNLSLTDFIALYDPMSLNNIDANKLKDKIVSINVVKNNGLFSKVEIDITEYIKLTNTNITSDILTFNYTDVNETEDFTKEYEGKVQQ